MTNNITLEIKVLNNSEDLPLPAYQSAEAAGLDLYAAIDEKTPQTLAPQAFVMIETGIAIALPQGYEAQIRPRSGLAAKHGVSVLNTPGTIDSDYRGEIKVLLINHGEQDFVIKRGTRIAQMIIAPVIKAHIKQVATLSDTTRGTDGFGSTGGISTGNSSKENK